MITWSSNSLLQEKDIRPNKNHAEISEQNRSDLQLVAAARELKSNCSQQSATTKLLLWLITAAQNHESDLMLQNAEKRKIIEKDKPWD